MRCSRLFLLLAFTGCDESTEVRPKKLTSCRSGQHQQSSTAFHGGPARLGWTSQETVLTPDVVGSDRFGLAWSSAPFDGIVASGTLYPGRAYASLLYADDVSIHGGPYDGAQTSVLFAATSNGFVYAMNAFEAPCDVRSIARGAMLWRTSLVTPGVVPTLDNNLNAQPPFPGIALGTLSTPVLDLHATPPTLYVTAMDAQLGTYVWKAFALDARSGAVLPGWPVVLDRPSVEGKNANGPAFFDDDGRNVSQRGALALSPGGDRLYVTFGGYWDGAVGWIVAIDTHAAGLPLSARLVASFSGAPDTLTDGQGNRSRHANAGMWGPSGPAVDAQGGVYMTTGNSDPTWEARPSTWGNSLLRWTKDLVLTATYTPYDFCALDEGDIDVGGSGAVLLPSLVSLPTSTPSLVTFGSKRGVAYLVDTTHMTGDLGSRPACSSVWDDASRDGSLLPPTADGSYCDFGAHATCVAPAPSSTCVPGPVVAFGPAGDVALVDHAKMRSTPAFFRADDGTAYVYLSGTTKAALCSIDNVPPSVVRLRIQTNASGAAYFVRDAADAADAADSELRFLNPGSPVVTSHGGADPVVWVVDENAVRTAALLDPRTPHPVLYAVDGTTMRVLYRSRDTDLEVGGKYVTPVIAHGTVFVATDRVQAFTIR